MKHPDKAESDGPLLRVETTRRVAVLVAPLIVLLGRLARAPLLAVGAFMLLAGLAHLIVTGG